MNLSKKTGVYLAHLRNVVVHGYGQLLQLLDSLRGKAGIFNDFC